MLYPKTSTCLECEKIQPLIDAIDCKLKQLSIVLYNNIVFMLNKTVDYSIMLDLINYKRILEYKKVNELYAEKYSVNEISNKVRLHTAGCVKDCIEPLPFRTTTTTTSTSTTSTTTTTTSSTTTTTTTTCYICSEEDLVIGTQTWMSCNLDVTTYRNGDPIPEVTDPTAWAALTTGAWCHYANNTPNGVIYGKLYNWYALDDPRGLGPVGYHVPTNTEYQTLTTFLGGTGVAGGALKLDQNACYWDVPNVGATNSSGWAGLPGGVRSGVDGQFFSLEADGYWWCSNIFASPEAYVFSLSSNVVNSNSFERDFAFGCSIRLIKD